MWLKVIILASVITIVFQNAQALQCYGCHSQKPSMDCFDPIDKSKVNTINCTSGNTRLDDEVLRASIDRDLLEKAESSSDFSCVVYEKHATGSDTNSSEIVRNCYLKIPGADICTYLNRSAQIESKNLLNCKSCDGDFCNGPPIDDDGAGTSVQASLFASLVCFIFVALLK